MFYIVLTINLIEEPKIEYQEKSTNLTTYQADKDNHRKGKGSDFK